MLTEKQIEDANKILATVDIKGKAYVQVNERIKAFRTVCARGAITSEIIDLTDGVVTIKASVFDDDGQLVATGLAQEKETSSYINKTSFIENCETSAVGRALGFLGIGVDGSMVSAEEVVNAITQQEALKKPVDKAHIDALLKLAKSVDVTEAQLTEVANCEINKMTIDIWNSLMKKLEATKKAKGIKAEAEEVFK